MDSKTDSVNINCKHRIGGCIFDSLILRLRILEQEILASLLLFDISNLLVMRK